MLRIKNLLSEKKKDLDEINIECYKLEPSDIRVKDFSLKDINVIFLKKDRIKCDINFLIKKFVIVRDNYLLKCNDQTEFDMENMLIRLLIKRFSQQNMELY